MSRSEGEAESSKRTFTGESAAKVLVTWLNSKNSATESDNRIQRLVEAAGTRRNTAEYAHGYNIVHAWTGKRVSGKRDRPKTGKKTEFINAEEQLNSILLHYKLSPNLWQSDRDRWTVNWLPAFDEPSTVTRHEIRALLKLIELAEQGLLSRIRRCENKDCRTWFYARFEHQRFHDTPCQQLAFRSKPDWKEHRREYMKELRLKHKQHVFRSSHRTETKRKKK